MLIIKEKELEDILVEHPDLIEEGLTLEGRQVTVYGRRMDLLFRDQHDRKLIVELKARPIRDQDIGQILSYEGMLLSADDPTVRVMLIGTRVPPNLQRSLDHHGIAWLELPLRVLEPYVPENIRDRLAFSDLQNYPKSAISKKTKEIPIGAKQIPAGSPALFAIIKQEFINKAHTYFEGPKSKLYFVTDAPIGDAQNQPIKNVYFKISGNDSVTEIADFEGCLSKNPSEWRLPGSETEEGKHYYGFTNLRKLMTPIKVTDLLYLKTGNALLASQPGACLIVEPMTQTTEGENTKNGSGLVVSQKRPFYNPENQELAVEVTYESGATELLKMSISDDDRKKFLSCQNSEEAVEVAKEIYRRFNIRGKFSPRRIVQNPLAKGLNRPDLAHAMYRK